MRIALFVTCIGDALFPEAGKAVVEVLERLGHEVVFPERQTCCGQMHANSGYREEADRLARRLVAQLEPHELVVSPSSSCVGYLREHVPALHGRLFELSELLVDRLEVEDVGASFPHRVVYHPTCHSLRVARVGEAPLRLLRAVRGLELVDLAEATECCGFGGTFAVKNAAVSSAMVADKCAHLEESGAEVCTAVDPSCHSLRVARVGEAPLRLLRAVRGLELVDLAEATECCGFGGTFAVKNAAVSSAMVADKCAHLEESGAEVCTAVDPSCLLNIGGALSRRGSGVRVRHLAEILASTDAS